MSIGVATEKNPFATAAPVETPSDVLRIEPTSGLGRLRLGEVWEYRELLFFLIWRDVKVRYKQTVLGAAWAIVQPLFTMVVFTIFFGGFAKISSDGFPYPIFSYAALLPWILFANGLANCASSLVGNANLLKKVYFPRLVIPIATVLAEVVDFSLAFGILLIMMFWYGIVPTANVIWLPFLLVLALSTSLGVGLWLAALNVQYRDVRYVVPFIVQVWMFATPVIYSSSIVSERWRTLYGLNPMVGVTEGFRWALLGTASKPGMMVALSMVVTGIILVSGLINFRRMERSFADVV